MSQFFTRTLRFSALTLFLLQVFSACVDTSPDYYDVPATDGGATDAASPAVDAALIAECRECVSRGACATQAAACNADPKCSAFLDCVLELYCIDFALGDLAKLPPCIPVCGQRAGILSQTDPAILAYAPVLFCGQDPAHCASVCVRTHTK
jgi:hypothetical protein